MPRKTDGEKIDDLEKLVAVAMSQISVLFTRVDAIHNAQNATVATLAELQRQHEKELALLKREDEYLNKWKEDEIKAREERNRRVWAFGPILVAAFISAIVALLVVYLNQRR